MTIWVMDEKGEPEYQIWRGNSVPLPNVGDEVSYPSEGDSDVALVGMVTKRKFLYARSGDDFDFAVHLSIKARG
jgi:hypothetical protein